MIKNNLLKRGVTKLFYGQNCSGRLGEKKTVLSVVGSKEDGNFVKFLNELNLKKTKRGLTRSNFKKATELAEKYSIKVSLFPISSEIYNKWKVDVYNHKNWFAKLYGTACYITLSKILDEKVYLQMDREYDFKTQTIAAETMSSLIPIKTADTDIYIRKEREWPSNRIIVADLFARGYFRGFDCTTLCINKNYEIKYELEKIFKKFRQ